MMIQEGGTILTINNRHLFVILPPGDHFGGDILCVCVRRLIILCARHSFLLQVW